MYRRVPSAWSEVSGRGLNKFADQSKYLAATIITVFTGSTAPLKVCTRELTANQITYIL